MIQSWFFGFHRPAFTAPNLIFGHVEAWGFTADETWLFIDPQGRGTKIVVAHMFDEVQAQLQARVELCDLILSYRVPPRDFTLPVHGPMTCAGICGSLVGVRALLPSTLRRRLLAKGAEVLHEAEGRPAGQGRATA